MVYDVPPLSPIPADREPALHEPFYSAPFLVALRRFLQKYATFSGRAGRAEYWWVMLAFVIVSIALTLSYGLITGDWDQTDAPVLFGIDIVLTLATLVPLLSLTWRRLHDTGRSGLWFFLSFIPLVGWIVLFVFTVQRPNPVGVRFDP